MQRVFNGRWWNKTDELDIMATDYSKKNYLLGECKYKNSPFAISDLKKMQKKFVTKKAGCALYYWIFSKSGYTKEVKEMANGENIKFVELEEIVTI